MEVKANAKRRKEWLIQALKWGVAILFAKTFLLVLWEYRNYFPANFQSNFLAGRELTFKGIYRTAFYIHIVTGPISLGICAFLMLSGKRVNLHRWHRPLGKALVYSTLLLMLPSGLVMATQALSGPIAGWSFFVLTLLTASSICVAAWHASKGRMSQHQVWATRSFILLLSPLLLRLMTGASIFFQFESEWTYRAAVWTSWLIPLLGLELYRTFKKRHRCEVSIVKTQPKFASQT